MGSFFCFFMAMPQLVMKQDAVLQLAQEEQEKEQFLEEANMLNEAQRRARILQEEAELSEREVEEDVSGTGDFRTKAESVKLTSYSAVLMVACFKDLMDYTIVFALPGISTVVSLCANTLILLLLFFPKRRYRIASNARLVIIDAFILLGLVPLEGLMFPFNLLPFTIAGVGMIYLTDKKFVAARNAKNFDRKAMKSRLSGVIGGAWQERKSALPEKSVTRERIQALNA